MFKWLKKEWNELWFFDGLEKLKKFSKRLGYNYSNVLLGFFINENKVEDRELRLICFLKNTETQKIDTISNYFPKDSEILIENNCSNYNLNKVSKEELKKYKAIEELVKNNKGKFKITIDFIPEEDTKENRKVER